MGVDFYMKKYISFLFIFTMSIIFSNSVFAAEITEINASKLQDNIMAINEINAAKYAISFVNNIYENLGFESGEVITFYNEIDTISGYCIDIMKDNEPNGYVVIKFSENKPIISEFCIESGVENPYKEIIEQYNISEDNVVFYSIGSNEYQIHDLNKNVICGFEDKILSVNKFKEYKIQARNYSIKKEEEKQAMFLTDSSNSNSVNYSGLDGWTVISDTYKGAVNSSATITGAAKISYYCSSDVSAINERYACSVVALCNLMKYYRSRGFTKISSSFSTLYSKLAFYAGTTFVGSTINGNEAGAAKQYLEEVGYNCSYKKHWSWVNNYSEYIKDLDNNKPSLFTYGATFGNQDGGHAVLAMGYVETTSYQYLQVADGWNSYLRYINFNGYDYSRKDGWSFSIS